MTSRPPWGSTRAASCHQAILRVAREQVQDVEEQDRVAGGQCPAGQVELVDGRRALERLAGAPGHARAASRCRAAEGQAAAAARSSASGPVAIRRRPRRSTPASDPVRIPRSISVPCGGSRPSRSTCRYTGSPAELSARELPRRDARRKVAFGGGRDERGFFGIAPACAGAPVRQQRSGHRERPDPTTTLPTRRSMARPCSRTSSSRAAERNCPDRSQVPT